MPDPVTKKPKSEKKSRPVAESRSATMTPVADNKECPNSSGEVEPKFEVVYRNHLNFTKFWFVSYFPMTIGMDINTFLQPLCPSIHQANSTVPLLG